MVVTLALNQYATADLPTTVRVSGLRPYNGG